MRAQFLLTCLATLECVRAGGQCYPFHATGTSFQDENITVIENIDNNTACCNVAVAYNAKASAMGMPTGKISVWWRDASLCLIKVDGKKPVKRPLTASNVLPKPKSAFRFATVYTDHMVLQAAPHKAKVWGFTVANDKVSVVLDNGVPIVANIKYTDASDASAPVMWSAVLPATEPSTSVTHTVTITSAKTGHKSQIKDVLFGLFEPPIASLAQPGSALLIVMTVTSNNSNTILLWRTHYFPAPCLFCDLVLSFLFRRCLGLQRPVQHGSCCLPHLPASSACPICLPHRHHYPC